MSGDSGQSQGGGEKRRELPWEGSWEKAECGRPKGTWEERRGGRGRKRGSPQVLFLKSRIDLTGSRLFPGR